jgi:hypothetical protein
MGYRRLQKDDSRSGAGRVGDHFHFVDSSRTSMHHGHFVANEHAVKQEQHTAGEAIMQTYQVIPCEPHRTTQLEEGRAALLLGLSTAQFRQLSEKAGAGQEIDCESGAARRVFTYAELYRMCRLAVAVRNGC